MRCLVACAVAVVAPAAFAFTADELAAKNVEAKGGLEKVHAIQSLRLSGTLRLQNDAGGQALSIPPPVAFEDELTGGSAARPTSHDPDAPVRVSLPRNMRLWN
ncbi:MAG: hypothetical protein JOZ93_08895 [Sinobacteraceae bacterium]|nr:hypothetical protein [Nevskiaceae bacterium]